MNKLTRKAPYGMTNIWLSWEKYRVAKKTRKALKNFVNHFYNGSQAQGAELLGNIIMELQKDRFYEDNDITAMDFLVDHFIKASVHEMEFTLKYKEDSNKNLIRRCDDLGINKSMHAKRV